MKAKYDHETIVTLQHLVVDKVSITRVSTHGGMVAIKLRDGMVLQLPCRLYSEAKEKLKMFQYKLRISQKEAIALEMF